MESINRSCQRRNGLFGEEDSREVFPKSVESSAASVGDHGSAARLCFERHDAGVFALWKKECLRMGIERRQFVVRGESSQFHGGTRESTQSPCILSCSHDRQRQSADVGDLDQEIETFVGHEPPDGEKGQTLRRRYQGRSEESVGDGRRDHLRFAVIDPCNAFLRFAGVAEETVDPLARREVPPAEFLQTLTNGSPQHARHAEILEVRFLHFPRVAHGGVAVADVDGVW